MQIKRILLAVVFVLLASQANATTYYIKNGGSNANNCTSDATACADLAGVTAKSPASGSDAYYKCGDTWTAVQTVGWSGTSSNPAIIGAYRMVSGTETPVSGTSYENVVLPLFDGGLNITSWTVTSGAPTFASYTGFITVSSKSYVTVENLHVINSGGMGIKFDSCTSPIARRNWFEKIYRTALNFTGCSSPSAIYNTTELTSLKTLHDPGTGSASFMFTGGSSNIYAAYNRIMKAWEGIDIAKNITGSLNVAEYNYLTNCQSASIYPADNANNVHVRYNLAACPTTNTIAGYWPNATVGCLGFTHTDEDPDTYGSSHHIWFYGNMAVNLSHGFTVNNVSSNAASTRLIVDDLWFFNNISINSAGANGRVAGPTTTKSMFFSTPSGFRNNIFVCTGEYGCSVGNSSAPAAINLSWDYNAYYGGGQDADTVGAHDVTLTAQQLADSLYKTSGWSKTTLTESQLTGIEFSLKSGAAQLIDHGVDKSAFFTQLLDLNTSNFVNGTGRAGVAGSFTLAGQSGAWDIGADVLVAGGGAPSTPSGVTATANGPSMINVAWGASTGSPTGYRIRWGSNVKDVPSSALSTTLYTLTASTLYSVTVAAYNATGESAASTAATATTAAFVEGDRISEDCASITDRTLSGGINWAASSGICSATDSSDSALAKMAFVQASGFPEEYTISIDNATFSDLPATYTSGTNTGRSIQVWSANGVASLGIVFAADGIWAQRADNSYQLIPSTAAYVTTTANQQWDMLVQNGGTAAPFSLTIYKNGTRITEATNVPCGYATTASGGTATTEARGTVADPVAWSFDAFYVSSGLNPPATPATDKFPCFAAGSISDIKTGSPTITVSDGVGTFSVSQTSDTITAGFEVSFGGGPTKCYVREIVLSQLIYKLVTPTGDVCGNATAQTVNSFKAPFDSMADAVDSMVGASYLNATDLVANKMVVKVFLGNTSDTYPVNIDNFTATSPAYTLEMYSPSKPSECVSKRWHALTTTNTDGIRVINNNIVLHDFGVTMTATNNTSQKALEIVGNDAAVMRGYFYNLLLRGNTSNTYNGHEGATVAAASGAAGSVIVFANIDADGFKGGTNSTSFNSADNDVLLYCYNCFSGPNSLYGFKNTSTALPVLKNCISVSTYEYSGSFAASGITNGSTSANAPGTGALNSLVPVFVNAAGGNFRPSASDSAWAATGTNLSDDSVFPIASDLDGLAIIPPYGLGPYDFQGSLALISSVGMEPGPVIVLGQSVTFSPVYPVAGTTCTVKEDGSVVHTDTGCAEASYTITPSTAGPHTYRVTSTKSGRPDEYVDAVTFVRKDASKWKFGNCSGSGADFANSAAIQPWVFSDADTIEWCGAVAMDLSGIPSTQIILAGDGVATLTGRSGLSFRAGTWAPSGLPTMGNDVMWIERILPLMNWSGTGGSVPHNTIFEGNGASLTINLSALSDPGDCYVVEKIPHAGLSFSSQNLGPCTATCTDPRTCVDPGWYRGFTEKWSQ